MAEELTECENRPTIFGAIPEKNVIFCVDTSGSMYVGLDAVKEDLIEALLKRAKNNAESTFNLIEFNSTVTQWADKMVRCTPETVNVAKCWIKDLCPKTGTNTQDALLTALNEPQCDAVYLVTDGLPDQYPEDILDHVGYAGQGRPIHCVYLVTNQLDSAASDFLEDLANETYGSFHVITLTNHGCVEKITPVLAVDHSHRRVLKTINGTIHPTSKACSVSTTLQADPEDTLLNLAPKVWGANNPYLNPYLYPYWQPHLYNGLWSRYRPARGWLKAQDELYDNYELSPSAGALLIGKRVLARHNQDGYFYLASVQSQILEDKFLIGFGPSQHGRFKDTVYQETGVYDIIGYEDAKRHAVISGDKVLAPWQPAGEKFCTGTVIQGHEKREADDPNDDEKLTVLFSNGKTETVTLDTAVWIPPAVFDRLHLELKMPAEARRSLEEKRNYPLVSLPGYPSSGPVAKPRVYRPPPPLEVGFDSLAIGQKLYGYPDYIPIYPICYKKDKKDVQTAVKSEDVHAKIPGTDLTQDELTYKVQSQLLEHLIENEQKEVRMDTGMERRKRIDELRRKRSCWEEEQKKLKTEAEIDRLNEEILRREVEIQHLTEEKQTEKENKDDLDGIKKRKALLEEIRKREKELEILLREEEASKEGNRLDGEREIRFENQREQAYRDSEREQKLRGSLRRETDVEREARIAEREAELERREREITRQIEHERILKRDQLYENNLRKSVSFKDLEDDQGYDSGLGSSPVFWRNPEFSENIPQNYRSFYGRKSGAKGRKSKQKPGWKYWGNEPSAEIGIKTTAASRGLKPFRETMLQAPLQAKDRNNRRVQTAPCRWKEAYHYNPLKEPRNNHQYVVVKEPRNQQEYMMISEPRKSQEFSYQYPLQWTSPSFRFVDTFAKHNYDNSVSKLMKNIPQPPSQPRQVIFPDSEVGVALGVRERTGPTQDQIKFQNRRSKVIARQADYSSRLEEQHQMKGMMEQQKRQRCMEQIHGERERQAEDLRAISQTMQAKQMMNQELRSRLSENTNNVYDRELRRLTALRAKREQREAGQAERLVEVEEKQSRQQAVKVMRSQMRWDEVNNRLNEEDRTSAIKEQQSRTAKINRIEHFKNLEEMGQRNKDLQTAVTDQHMALYRSQVLP